MTNPSAPRTYIIEYTVYFLNGQTEEHTAKVKGCTTELFARVKLEKWSLKRYIDMDHFTIQQCREWNAVDKLFNGFMK